MKKGRRGRRGKLGSPKSILSYLYSKRVVNVDVTELNVSLGSDEEVLESEKNVLRLLGDMVSALTP